MYDILFLGGGPGGYEGAIAAAKKGLKTAVVEMDKVGGTCLQRGCVPTKALLHNVKILKQLKNASKVGISVGDVDINLGKIAKNKERVVSKLTKGIESLFKQHNIDLLNGRGTLTAADTVRVEKEGQEPQDVSAKNIVLCLGSNAPNYPS